MKKKDPESEAAMEVVAMQHRQEMIEKLGLKKRDITIASVFEEIGRIKAMNMNRGQAEFLALILLKRLKENKAYKDLDMTWDQTCDLCGMSRRTVDEKLVDLRPFKSEFLGGFANFIGFDFNKIKYLAEDKNGGSAEIKDGTIIYQGEAVPLNQEDIQTVIDKIQEDLGKRAENAEAEVRAAKRVARDKEALINKQAKDLDRYAGRARSKDLSPEEDGFLAQMEQLKIGFDGYMLSAEPGRMEELRLFGKDAPDGDLDSTVTPRMRAAYIETLGYMRRQVIAAYDTAVEIYGHDMEVAR